MTTINALCVISANDLLNELSKKAKRLKERLMNRTAETAEEITEEVLIFIDKSKYQYHQIQLQAAFAEIEGCIRDFEARNEYNIDILVTFLDLLIEKINMEIKSA